MKRIVAPVFITMLLCGFVHAQVDSEQLAKLPKILNEKIAKEMPGWTHRSVEPIEGSKNVIIEFWESNYVTVKVAISQYETKADADLALKEFRSHIEKEEQATTARRKVRVRLIKDELTELGDGGFIWDIRGSDAAVFRKQNFLVCVSVVQPAEYNDEVLSKQFAQRVAAVLTAL